MAAYAQFENQAYLCLATIRKNGQKALTPIWFARQGSRMYFSTAARSGKVKRIRREPQVEINPCTASGDLLGFWEPAAAHIASETEGQAAEAALDAKYGEARRDFMRRNPIPPSERVYGVIELPGALSE